MPNLRQKLNSNWQKRRGSLALGLLTPPSGILLFTMKSVAPKEITMQQVFGAVPPYVIFGILMLLAVIAFPPVATWLPKALFGK